MKVFQQSETTFCVFAEPEWGLRVMGVILRTYKRKYGLSSPLAIVSRWAPASDPRNNPATYAVSVAKSMSATLNQTIGANDQIDVDADAVLIGLIKAIAKVENGIVPPYSDVQYAAALLLLPANLV